MKIDVYLSDFSTLIGSVSPAQRRWNYTRHILGWHPDKTRSRNESGLEVRIQSTPMITNRSPEEIEVLHDWISNHRYVDDRLRSVLHKNNRYITYDCKIPKLDPRFILKEHRPGPGYSLQRRISFRLRTLRTNYARKAYEGALLLNEAGVPTIEPIAYWTVWRGAFQRVGYFLYEKVEAQSTLFELYHEAGNDRNQHISQLLIEMARVAKILQRSRIYHGDLATHNFLVIPDIQDQVGGMKYRLLLLDTDHVKQRMRLTQLLFGCALEMRNLRRLDLNEEDKRAFLKEFLNRDEIDGALRWMFFWKWWGERPIGKYRDSLLRRCKICSGES